MTQGVVKRPRPHLDVCVCVTLSECAEGSPKRVMGGLSLGTPTCVEEAGSVHHLRRQLTLLVVAREDGGSPQAQLPADRLASLTAGAVAHLWDAGDAELCAWV